MLEILVLIILFLAIFYFFLKTLRNLIILGILIFLTIIVIKRANINLNVTGFFSKFSNFFVFADIEKSGGFCVVKIKTLIPLKINEIVAAKSYKIEKFLIPFVSFEKIVECKNIDEIIIKTQFFEIKKSL